MIPERWLVIRVRAPSDELVTELAEGLVALGGSAVEEEMDVLTTYVAPPADPEAFVRAAYDRLQAIVPGAALELSWDWRRNEDWESEWRRGLRPRRVGERLVVTPSWIEPYCGPGDILLVIDPKMAFGTGEHATTRAMLRLLESATRPGDRVLDVGTGTGILAIAAVRLGAVEALGVDSDVMALENAAENVERNGAAAQVRLECARVDAAFLEQFSPGRLDLILANVSSTALMPLLGPFHDALGRGGRLVVGGILEHEAEVMMASAGRAGLELRAVAQEAGWWSGLFERASATAGQSPTAKAGLRSSAVRTRARCPGGNVGDRGQCRRNAGAHARGGDRRRIPLSLARQPGGATLGAAVPRGGRERCVGNATASAVMDGVGTAVHTSSAARSSPACMTASNRAPRVSMSPGAEAHKVRTDASRRRITS